MTLNEIFENCKNIAVVGMSRDIYKAAYTVPGYMKKKGYNIIPVNPFVEEIMHLKSYPDLMDIPDYIDMLNVFRPSQDCLAVVERAIERKKEKGDISVIWLQLGIVNNAAKMLAEENGIFFIQDKCIYVEHKQIYGNIAR